MPKRSKSQSGHMFKRRPRTAAPPLPERPSAPQGLCYDTPQEFLRFGSNRRKPVSSRPVVTLFVYLGIVYCLPGTSQKRGQFFHIHPEQCASRSRHSAGLTKDTYLTHEYEALSVARVPELRALGQLHAERRHRLLTWAASRWR